MKVVLLLTTILLPLDVSCSEIDLSAHSIGIWSIAGTAHQLRWVIIHNLTAAKDTGIYHLEVIAKDRSAPAWKIERLVKHMAITKTALTASVVKPLTKGAVYPESFDYAFITWKEQNAGAGGTICETTVTDCIKNGSY
ncbi:DUF5086 domain-containing protein [Gammaproteobacteria bacterium]